MTQTQLDLPTHVSPSLVRDFDAFADLRLAKDPYAFFRELAETYPSVFYSRNHGGHWVIVGKEAVRQALGTPELFGNGAKSFPNTNPDAPAMFVPIQYDPPQHTRYREMLNPMFRPNAIWKLEHGIREFTHDLIRAVIDQGECEFVKAIALPLPVLVFMRQMALPEERYEEFAGWIREILTGDTAERRNQGTAQSLEYIRTVVMEREPDSNGDWVRRLLATELDGRLLDRETEVWPICNLLFLGGLDTVKNALCHTMRTLSARPDLQKRLREDPACIPTAIEELFHFLGGVNPPRMVMQDIEFMGAQMRKGDLAICYTGTANDNPHDINDPSTIDIDRDIKTHMGFGVGPHKCLGAVLARLELKVFLEEWLKAIPSFEVKPDAPLFYSPGMANSVEHLELRWPRRS